MIIYHINIKESSLLLLVYIVIIRFTYNVNNLFQISCTKYYMLRYINIQYFFQFSLKFVCYVIKNKLLYVYYMYILYN